MGPVGGEQREIRANCDEHTLKDGRRIYVLAKGRLVNLAAAEGHPSEVMDMSFANQTLAQVWLAREGKKLQKVVYDLPAAQNAEIATIKLGTMGLKIDRLTDDQKRYANDYSAGT